MPAPDHESERPVPSRASVRGDIAALDDPGLVERLRSGDEAAYDTIYLASVTSLVRFAYSYVNATATAEDVVADTFVQLWERRAELEPRFGLRAWLFAAVRHRALTAFRGDRRASRFMDRLREAETDEVTDLGAVEATMDAVAVHAALRQAVERLSEDRRRLVALRWYEGLTVPQIAHVLGLSVGAVEQRLLRTINTLRAVLDIAR